jgi:uncharacterized membrane protein
MPKLSEHAKQIGRKIGINDEKGYGIAVFLALIVVIIVIAGFFVSDYINGKPQGYNTIYLLDANHKAADYAGILIANQNSTFSVYVCVENHNSITESYQVQVKITQNLSSYPLTLIQPSQVFETGNIGSGEGWQNQSTITQNQPGEYAVVFELYRHSAGGLEFASNYCVLNFEVKSST